MNATRRIVSGATTLIMGVVALAAVVAAAAMAGGYRAEPVLSGSMAPKMPIGSVAVVKPVPADSIRVGDVVTFQDPANRARRITHRIKAITVKDGVRLYTTKGDANPSSDPWQLRLPGTVGRRVAVVPKAGYVLNFAARGSLRGALMALLSFGLLIGVLRAIWSQPTAPRKGAEPQAG